jgi:polysaccharide pyruvyl transferase WcaK-like protein
MGKNKKYVLISEFNLNDSNRGNAALAYGSIEFLKEKLFLKGDEELISIYVYRNRFRKSNILPSSVSLEVDGVKWHHTWIRVFFIEWLLFLKFGLLNPFSRFGRVVRHSVLSVALNGGDGFSDIYGTSTFLSRLKVSYIAIKRSIPLILMPQTIGPFSQKANREIADKLLKYSKKIYVRDTQFVDELDKMGLKYEQTKDLSYYMKPQPWDIQIDKGTIGINVSGLAYSNKYRSLSGQFECYPILIDRLITHFRDMGHQIVLIPHSYNYQNPEKDNDDMIACKQAFDRLKDKSGVSIIDKDLISPQAKYIISKLSFFVGTRMHANFAAIYTNVPVFGLSYSYKFKGAFDANGLDGEKQTVMVKNITEEEIPRILKKVDAFYQSIVR